MPRLLFEKTGNAIWISHLDLMRLFQRAFQRAGLQLTHTQGYNPRPSVSIALPLSVGVESICELLDFDLNGEMVDCEEICSRLNQALVPGVQVLRVYNTGKKLKDLAFLQCSVLLEYNSGIPENANAALEVLFARESILVTKKGKNGVQVRDISPMIQSLSVVKAGEKEIQLDAVVCCQNPTLNPMQLVAAIDMYLPELKPDFAKCRRMEIFDLNNAVFR